MNSTDCAKLAYLQIMNRVAKTEYSALTEMMAEARNEAKKIITMLCKILQ